MEYILAKPANIRSTFDSLPRNVPEAYRGVIDRIEKGQNKTIAFKILSWILLARRVLAMRELQEALSVEDGVKELIPEKEFIDPRYVVECCESLINHDQDTQTVRLTHYTLNDFLHKECTSFLLPSLYLARTCLTYLNFDEFVIPGRVETLVAKRLEAFQFLGYAVTFWDTHTQGDPELPRDILPVVLRIFATASRLTSLLEVSKFLGHSYETYDWSTDISETALHTVSRHGLSTSCKKLLDAR